MHAELLDIGGHFPDPQEAAPWSQQNKAQGWNVSLVPTLLCIPTENLTRWSLLTSGLGDKFHYAPWLFPKYVLISDSAEIEKAENSDPLFLSLLLCPQLG